MGSRSEFSLSLLGLSLAFVSLVIRQTDDTVVISRETNTLIA